MARFKTVSSTRSGRAGRKSSKLQMLMVAAPIVLQLVTQYRNNQKSKRGRLYQPSKREKLLDTLLDQANRRFGNKAAGKRGGFF